MLNVSSQGVTSVGTGPGWPAPTPSAPSSSAATRPGAEPIPERTAAPDTEATVAEDARKRSPRLERVRSPHCAPASARGPVAEVWLGKAWARQADPERR